MKRCGGRFAGIEYGAEPGLKPFILVTSSIAAPEGAAPLTEVRGFHLKIAGMLPVGHRRGEITCLNGSVC
jgi:hypothetical protein